MNDALALWERYNDAGQRSLSQGRLAEAEQSLLAAAREAEQLGGDSSQLALTLHSLGQLRLQAKEHDAAEDLFQRALAMREATLGAEHLAVAQTLTALAGVHEARGALEPAEELLRRALSIYEQQCGAAHPDVSSTLSTLAKLLFRRRDFAKADRVLLRLLEIKRALGKEHPEVATVLASLAKLRQVVGKHDQGEQLWRQALAIRERSFAPNDPLLATTLEQLADCCAAQAGRLADAMALRERALAIREASQKPDHPAVEAARAKLRELQGLPPTASPPSDPLELDPPFLRTSQEVPLPRLSDPPGFPSMPSPPNVPIFDHEEPPPHIYELPPDVAALRQPELPVPAIPPPAPPPAPGFGPPPAALFSPPPPPVAAFVPPAAPPMARSDVLAPGVSGQQQRPRRAPRADPPPRAHERARPRTASQHTLHPVAQRTSTPTRTTSSGSGRGVLGVLFVLAIGLAGGWLVYKRDTAPPPAPRESAKRPAESATERAVDAIGRGTIRVIVPSTADSPTAGDATQDSLALPTIPRSTGKAADAPLGTLTGVITLDSSSRNAEQAGSAKSDSAQRSRLGASPVPSRAP